jgi:hypothetical protein
MQNMRLFLAKRTATNANIQSSQLHTCTGLTRMYNTLSSLRYVLQWSSVVYGNYTV